MSKIQVKNPRFELVNSTIKGYKEVEIIFDYNGEDYKYFIFIEEGKNVNYIKEAKKQFEKDLKLGKVGESLKKPTTPKPYLIVGAALGAVALTFAGLFIWKTVASSQIEKTSTEYLELPSKITRTATSTVDAGTVIRTNVTEIETTQVIKNKKIASTSYTETTKIDGELETTAKGISDYNDYGNAVFDFNVSEMVQSAGTLTFTTAIHHEYKYNDKGLITWEREVVRNKNTITNAADIAAVVEKSFEYDDLNRLTKEIHNTRRFDDPEFKETYIDIRTYKDNFKTFVTDNIYDEESDEELGPITTSIENVLDDKGNIISSHQKEVLDFDVNEIWKYNTYDENYCLVHEEVYNTEEKTVSNLVSERRNTFYNNDPKKLSSSNYWAISGDDTNTMLNYTFASKQFDQYGRTTDTLSDNKIINMRSGRPNRVKSGKVTQHYEYDQLIPA